MLFSTDRTSIDPDIDWRINVDAMKFLEFETLCSVLCTIVYDTIGNKPFSLFQGMIPGGDSMAKMLNALYQIPNMTKNISYPPIIVNDVWISKETSNGDIETEMSKSKALLGVVMFSRGTLPPNVIALFQQHGGSKYNKGIYRPFGEDRFGPISF